MDSTTRLHRSWCLSDGRTIDLTEEAAPEIYLSLLQASAFLNTCWFDVSGSADDHG